jgi:L-cysteine:1D-myo-inositol 2-amino-2-deoxy-alpha-D-glucopyranoside ligase
MRLHDTATRSIVQVTGSTPDTTTPGSTASDNGLFTMYVCGVTPYDAAHLGHGFTFMTFDLIRRRVEDLPRRVKLVRNITDVDEPLYAKAAELGVHFLELARLEERRMQSALGRLGLIPPEAEPRASEHLDDIVAMIQSLLAAGAAYELDGDIYFDVSATPDYGRVSGYSPQLMTKFAQMRGGDPERAGKRQPLDFLLWRRITDAADPARWETPLGPGRPGWHIECSVMADKHLGTGIDIHGGGADLIFPHHECEQAQSTAAGRVPFVKSWVHVGPMLMGGEKMSKSLGNLVFVDELLDDHSPAAIRLALMRYHYRCGGEWRPEFIEDGEELARKLRKAAADVSREEAAARPAGPLLREIRGALDDNLDAPRCVRVLESCLSRPIARDLAADVVRVADLLGIGSALG